MLGEDLADLYGVVYYGSSAATTSSLIRSISAHKYPSQTPFGHDGDLTAKQGYIRSIEVTTRDDGSPRDGFPWELPAVAALEDGLSLDSKVTYLVGENGSGKSTLIEAFAVAAGLNPEGGSRNFSYSTRDSHSGLPAALRLVRGERLPKTDFFLRAESFFTAATYLESLKSEDGRGGNPLASYGGKSLHEQSHGESFLALILNRFGPEGLYFLDEPEAALSAQNCLTCLQRMHQLVQQGSQFVIATHSPILLAYPGATIYECGEGGLRQIEFEEAESVRLTRSFLESRERFLDRLLAE
jgi:predicted ATPase